MATPLSLQGGRVDINDPVFKNLLRSADIGKSSGGILLTGGNPGAPTLRGRRIDPGGFKGASLEVFRNGHVEFLLRDRDQIEWAAALAKSNFNTSKVLVGVKMAEWAFRVLQFSRELAEAVAISDPYLFTISFWNISGFSIDRGSRNGGGHPWTESQQLFVEPVLVSVDEAPDEARRRILTPVWNTFGHEGYGFDDNGRFRRPD
jgi:hypothetical protein